MRERTSMILRWWASVLVFFCTAAVPAQPAADSVTVSGSAAYLQRIAMPPDAVLTVRVEDVSRADAPAPVLAETREPFGARQVPIPFSLTLSSAAIDSRSSYAVRATITVGGELRFTTTRRYAVLTRGASNQVDLILEAVPPAPSAGSQVSAAPAAQAAATSLGFDLPATFVGLVPCADCPGIAQTLTLRADGLYRLRRTYLSKPEGPFSELGRWTEEAGGKVLRLRSGSQATLFAVRDDASLRLLDRLGQPIRSTANLDLRRSAAVDPIRESLRWRGEFLYLADAATFTDCASGLRWPVAMAEGYLAVERDYVHSRSAPGAPLLVVLDGRLEWRPAMEGEPREHLVIERLAGSQPGATCDSPAPGKGRVATSLQDTYWKLLELDGKSIGMTSTQEREARLTLSSVDARVTAFAGCNRLSGAYVQDGSGLRFTQMAGTRMACAAPLMELERRFLLALGAATAFRIEGEQMILLGGSQVLARFEAVSLR